MKLLLPALLAIALFAPAARAEDPVDPKAAAAEAKAKEAEAKVAVDALKASLKEKTNEPKLAAIAECGSVPHALTAAALSPFLVDPSDEVRIATASALGKMTLLPEAAKALHSAIKPNETNAKVIDAVFNAIGEVGHPASVMACSNWIHDHVSQRDYESQPGLNAAFDAMGALKFKACVTELIDLMHKNEVANGARGGKGLRAKSEARARKALQRLTGEDLSYSNEWSDWWKKHASEYNDDLTKK